LRVLDRRGLDAIGAVVRLEAAGRPQYRQVQPNQSYCSSNDPRVHFGLGAAARAERVTVRWPDGQEEVFGPLEADRIHELRRGATASAR
jgi:hypothetical protein